MKLISLKVQWFKNLDIDLDFTQSEWVSVFVWNNGSGKSNVLEAISAIFYGLYDEAGKKNPPFSYEIKYEIGWHIVEVQQSYSVGWWAIGLTWSDTMHRLWPETKWHLRTFTVDRNSIGKDKTKYLPDQIIALYSWEETRLYESYYKDLYDTFVDKVIDNAFNFPKMSFISRAHWDIALLVLLNSDYDLSSIIWDLEIQKITLQCNNENINRFYTSKPSSVINSLAKQVSEKPELTLSEFRSIFQDDRERLYAELVGATLHKTPKNRLFEGIEILLKDATTDRTITGACLSEWQKKQILIYFVTQILANKDTVILLDEPDSYIHVGNKDRIKGFIDDFLAITREGEFIITTHSPTLMHRFDRKHLFYLDSWKLESKEKAEILKEIAWDSMSYTEQQIILNTAKDILIVEWKTDETYIKTALEKLKPSTPEYQSLDFEFLLMGWSDHEVLKRFSEKFPAKPWQKIMAFFDGDGAWFNCIKEALWKTNLDKNSFRWERLGDVYVSFYPKKPWFTQSDFEAEDYFNIEICRDFQFNIIETFSNLKQWFKKPKFAQKCQDFEAAEFEWFRVLFDTIIGIERT